MKKSILFPVFALLTLFISIEFTFLSLTNAQSIPLEYQIDWSNVGYPDEFPDSDTIRDVISFGAVPNDTLNDFDAFQSAILSLNGRRGIVFMPAGTYLLGQTLYLPDSVVLRGVGADKSHLEFDFDGSSGEMIVVQGGKPASFTSVISGFEKGSYRIKITDPNGFSQGDYVELRQENGSWDLNPAVWAAYSVGQILKITEIRQDTLIFDRALRIDYDTSLNLEIGVMDPARQVGLECFSFERMDYQPNLSSYGIQLFYAVESWMKGLEGVKSIGSHVFVEAGARITVQGCYFQDAFEFDGVGTRGYGVTLAHHASDILVENNVFRKLRHAMMVKQGANGNVFGYNYSREPYRVEIPQDAGGDISLHGHYPFSNLFEGNISQNIITDHYWGEAGPYNTFFRNRAEWYGLFMWPDQNTGAESDKHVFIGNEVTNLIPFFGNYGLLGTGHYEFGNNIKGDIVPPGSEMVSDSSYYLEGKPDFWFTNGDWPLIGWPNALGSGTIPAKERFVSGGNVALCGGAGPVLSSNDYMDTGFNFEIGPNPFSEIVFVRAEKMVLPAELRLLDVNGKLLVTEALFVNETTLHLGFLPEGIYIVQVSNELTNKTIKLLKQSK